MSEFSIDTSARPLPILRRSRPDGSSRPFAEAQDVADLVDIAAAFEAYPASSRRWLDKVVVVDRPSADGRYRLHAEKMERVDKLRVHIHAEDGRIVARHYAELSGWRTEFVLGHPSLNGGSLVEAPLRGQGLGRMLYDLVEETAGLPLVPHGSFCVHGELSEEGAAFWRKRYAATGRRPDGDAETRRRMAVILRSEEGLALDRLDLHDPWNATAHAEAVGGEVAFVANGKRWRTHAFVRGPDGVVHGKPEDPEGLSQSFVTPEEGWARLEIAAADEPDFGRPRSRQEARSLVAAFLERSALRLAHAHATPVDMPEDEPSSALASGPR